MLGKEHAAAVFKLLFFLGCMSVFIDSSKFPFLTSLSKNAALIADELKAALESNQYVRDTVGTEKKIDPRSDEWSWDNGINRDAVGYDLREGGYSMLALYKKNSVPHSVDVTSLFPETFSLLEQVPGLQYAAFAALPPRGHLGRHAHSRSHFVFHVLLSDLIDGRCEVSCGSHVKALERAGDSVLFDYSLPHETRNYASNTRFNLLVDFTPKLGAVPIAANLI